MRKGKKVKVEYKINFQEIKLNHEDLIKLGSIDKVKLKKDIDAISKALKDEKTINEILGFADDSNKNI